MKKHHYNRRLIYILLGCFLAIVAKPFFRANAALAEPLSLEISSPKQEWLVAEPVLVRVVFVNNTTTNQLLSAEFQVGISSSAVSYLISKDNKNFKPLEPLLFRDPVRQWMSISPGESFYHDELLTYDAGTDGLVFPIPGEYYVRVDYREQKSNVLKIQVKEAMSADDRKWAGVMRSRDVLLAITPYGGRDVEALKKLGDCTKEPSVFSPYAAFFLASAETNKTNALALLDKADVANFPLQSHAVFEKARINLELGDKQKAHEQFERVLNSFSNSAAASEVKRKNLLESSKP